MSEQEPKKPGDIDNNVVSDWEGADDLEQDLQDKIKSNMEKQEPKIEQAEKIKVELRKAEWDLVMGAFGVWSNELLGKKLDPETGARFEGDQIVEMIQGEIDKNDDIVRKIEQQLK